jgi:AcrR family transcriptional regulator
MSTTRQRWLDEGLAVLAEEGEGGLRIDRLATRLGLTKGSFFHHFGGAAGYRTALLEEHERTALAALTEAIEARPDEGTGATLAWLTEHSTSGPGTIRRADLDLAVRAWASSDPEARATQERLDTATVEALQAVWRPAVSSDEDARIAALVPYLVSLGAATIVPPIALDELRRVYELLLANVPEVTARSSRAASRRR